VDFVDLLKTADAPELTGAGDPASTIAGLMPFTMHGGGPLIDLAHMVCAALTFDIPGDMVDCGAWRGGASFLMADVLRRAEATDRRVWLFDAFEGPPAPRPVEGPATLVSTQNTDTPGYYDNSRASLDDVRRTAARLGVAAHIRIVKGWYEQTLPLYRERLGPIAILRIDGDWYSSVRCCLENLFDQVVEGGLVIIHDYYAYDGCRLAVHDFLSEHHVAYPLESVIGPPADQLERAVIRKGKSTWKWLQQLYLTRQDIAAVIPSGATFALVDQQWFSDQVVGERRAIPFVERNGQDWGSPPDDETAIRELDRLQQAGASFLAIAWPAFWWLDYYAGLHRHLRSTFRCVLENDRLIVFELQR